MPRRRDVDRLQKEIEELFSDLWQVPRFAGVRRGFRPAVDCFRTDDPPGLTVVVELPGVDPATVAVVATARALVISGERMRPPAEGRRYQQMEIASGPFERQIALDADIDTRRATATYGHGLLTIVLPAAEPQRAVERVAIPVEARS